MGQVPRKIIQSPYGVVGDGRAARHIAEYFKLLGIPFAQWSRKLALHKPTPVSQYLAPCEIILILIKDSEIENFIGSQPFLSEKTFVHFSGALVSELAIGFHPLMTFTENLYDLDLYKKIPFIGETGRPSFSEIFPGLPNPSFDIPVDKKAYYHSLCVMSGNFTTLLWQKFFYELEKTFSIPAAAAFPYLQQTAENLRLNPAGALTGPFARRDAATVEKNLRALSGDSFEEIYRSFSQLMSLEKAKFQPEVTA